MLMLKLVNNGLDFVAFMGQLKGGVPIFFMAQEKVTTMGLVSSTI